MTPYQVKKKTDNATIPVPCGKCPDCLKRRVSGWSFRLMQQDKVATSAHFITLTYDTDHVTITDKGYMSLNKRDVQLFLKRLRKLHVQSNIKYYAVGEYGGRTNRPHYHIILFNASLELIQPAWNMGQVHYGEVTGASIGYTLKYMTKQGKIPMHANDDRVPEFSLMSKGLGQNYLTLDMIAWHLTNLDNNMHCVLLDGRKIAMPRYYKDKIYAPHERKRAAHFGRILQLEAEQKREAEMIKKYGDDYRRTQVDIDKNKFKKMYSDATKNRTKI